MAPRNEANSRGVALLSGELVQSAPDSVNEEGASLQLRRTWLYGLAVAAVALTFSPPTHAHAESEPIQVILDGRVLSFDVPPVIEQSVTMVPVRAVLTPLGATFSWDPVLARVTALLPGTRVEAVVGERTALVNGEPAPLPMPVLNQQGRTLIPLRFFAEELGFAVDWNGDTRTVFLRSGRADTAVSREASRRTGELILSRAVEQVGMGYAWGGTRPETGFDCSGLITYLSDQVGQEVPRTSQELFATGAPVADEDLAPGDLVFFSTYEPGASHVGVYDGDGGFVHAQSPEVGVVRTALSRAYWAERYLGARRVFR